jgi:integrase
VKRLPKHTAFRVNFLLKRPSEKEKRRTFQILRVTINRETKKPQYSKIQDQRLDALNKLFLEGVHDFSDAEKQAESLREDLYKAELKAFPKVVFNSQNLKLLDTYWKEEYAHRHLVDESSSRYELQRAVEALGSISLVSASARDIQAQVNKHFTGRKQARIISSLHQLLGYLGRKDVKLIKAREEVVRVRHLSEEDFLTVATHIEDETFRLLATVAFYSGLRFGELFGLSEDSLRSNGSLYIDSQVLLTKEGKFVFNAEPKWGKIRVAVPVPEGAEYIKKLCAMDKEKLTEEYRKKDAAEIIRQACIKAFPNNRAKWCVFHDLRHSYAWMLAKEGFGIGWIASNLGNSEAVCRKYYLGWISSDETVSAQKLLFEKNRKEKKKAAGRKATHSS